jgi:hypothetical protein
MSAIELQRHPERERAYTLRSYDVIQQGQVIGIVERVKWTAERRSPGKMYVNARWQGRSPRWEFTRPGDPRAASGFYSRKSAIEMLILAATP